MKFAVATKIVSLAGNQGGTATLTREGKQVYCQSGGSQKFTKDFETVTAAKKFMGETKTV